jgi:hypothetical protein
LARRLLLDRDAELVGIARNAGYAAGTTSLRFHFVTAHGGQAGEESGKLHDPETNSVHIAPLTKIWPKAIRSASVMSRRIFHFGHLFSISRIPLKKCDLADVHLLTKPAVGPNARLLGHSPPSAYKPQQWESQAGEKTSVPAGQQHRGAGTSVCGGTRPIGAPLCEGLQGLPSGVGSCLA